MNKKKLLTIAMVLSMAAILAIGGTIAYFTDTDKEANVFTIGKVDIDLIEDFPLDTDTNKDGENDAAKLIPGKRLKKEVRVKNESDSEPAYVRVHVAIPSILDSGSEDNPEFAAYNNTLHVNFTAESVQEGKWSQLQNSDQHGSDKYPNWPGNGGPYNFYQAKIDNVDYNVYVYTYETALEAGEETKEPAITQVYLDTKIDDEGLEQIKQQLGTIQVLVFAEGGQKEGFTDPYVALNTQFGDPMAEGYVAPWNKK